MQQFDRVARGAVCGVAGTVALTALRQALKHAGLVHTTAPEQVVARLDELRMVHDWSPVARRALAVAAHLAYGVGTGAAFGWLRREQGGKAEEAAVGSALGILAWGAGWSTWLPLTGVHEPPWKQRTWKVLLPVVDHAFFGAVWGILYRAPARDPR